ncbi:hypothetical protein ACFYKX_27155 [Cytobacillus sp. FJAT-54145]|uniref:Uncharacterized protein n=1 Tax=Cytobacillus spartinae TaxID=3299023 RepID=A0ABW6KJ66_9BACI
MTNIEKLLNQKEQEERSFYPLIDLEPMLVAEVLHIMPDLNVPEELKTIQAYWKDEAEFYGDVGACVLGAGFEFNYQEQRYFMPPISRWQGSVSWEHCKDEIEKKLLEVGATDIHYDFGRMD